MNRPTLSVRYDGTVRIVFPGRTERLRAAVAELLELATDLLRVTAAPIRGGRADKAIADAREILISVRKGGRGESPEPLSAAPLSQDRGAALDSVVVELSMEEAKYFSANLQMTLQRASNHDIGPLCDAWTAGFGVCALPEHHTGDHDFKRPLGPEHMEVLHRGRV